MTSGQETERVHSYNPGACMGQITISNYLLWKYGSVIFVNENENENYQKRKNNDFVNEN